ncbi:MAG: AAA family ATPase [Myxococcota bacterium]|jgi:predicted ATPase
MSARRRIRVVVTGGPGGGKTTAADLFRRELAGQVIVVPESATLLFSGGFPRAKEAGAVRAAQRAIFEVQRSLEDVTEAAHPECVLLCDRGTVDGAAYWPGTPADFFSAMGTSLDAELRRYDAVLFFESAAVGNHPIEGNNPVRVETHAEAAALDKRLFEVWSRHPRFTFVKHRGSFFRKMTEGFDALARIVAELGGPNGHNGGR